MPYALAWPRSEAPDPELERALGNLRAVHRVSPEILTCGQPEIADFAALQKAGCDAVLNLLPPGQENSEEEPAVTDLGMDYEVIPVVWNRPLPRDLERFEAQMDAWQGRPILVHCAANLRVSSFVFLWRTRRGICTPEAAQADLDAVWTPNPIWAEFIREMAPAP
jgi:protein tyrosine phosphatase (PTP) superfamily phosphohydrolase (DUF442 family)